jgi:hypothetical protein
VGGEDALAALGMEPASTAVAGSGGMTMHQVGEAAEEVDPAVVQAERRTEAALLRLTYHDAPEAVTSALAKEVLPSHKVLFLVDAQTSKATVGTRLMERAAAIMDRGGAGGGTGKAPLGGSGERPGGKPRAAGLGGMGRRRRASRARSASSSRRRGASTSWWPWATRPG